LNLEVGTSPATTGAPWARRNRAALLALLPLVVLALGACVYWVYLVAHISLGAVALFFPLAVLVLPTSFGLCLSLVVATFGGLGSLCTMLWMGASARRWLWAAPAALLGFAYIGMWPFLRDSLAELVGAGFSVDWAAAALLANGAFALVAGLMAVLIVLPERAAPRYAVWRGLVGIALVWAASFSALGPALGWVREDLQSRSISLVDEISTEGNRNPIVVAVCAGRLAEAAELIRSQGRQLGEGDVDALQSRCLRTNTSRFYAERVGVVLDAILAWEARGASQVPQVCTSRQKSLLRRVYENDFPDAAMQAFAARGLPIVCPLGAQESEPVWWSVVHSAHELDAQRLTRLQALGIDLQQTDNQGLGFVGANPNGLIDASLSDAALLRLAELGLRDQPGGQTPHALVIEVMKRRHGLGAGDAASPDLLRAFQLVGEPTDAQLREVLERAPFMLRAYSDTQREREPQLRDAIVRRLGHQ
jgi:hypothetical protein